MELELKNSHQAGTKRLVNLGVREQIDIFCPLHKEAEKKQHTEIMSIYIFYCWRTKSNQIPY